MRRMCLYDCYSLHVLTSRDHRSRDSRDHRSRDHRAELSMHRVASRHPGKYSSSSSTVAEMSALDNAEWTPSERRRRRRRRRMQPQASSIDDDTTCIDAALQRTSVVRPSPTHHALQPIPTLLRHSLSLHTLDQTWSLSTRPTPGYVVYDVWTVECL